MFAARGFFALDANIAWLITPQMPACYVENFNCTVVPDTALLWKTTDGGNHWQGQFVSSVPWGYVPMSIQFVDKQTGWLLLMSFIEGNLRYQLHQTTDGGEHWQPVMIADTHPTVRRLPDKEITAVVFQDPRNGWMSISEICCEAQVIKEWKIYHSTDAGSTWEPFLLPAPDPLPATFLQNPAQCAAQDIEVTQPNILDVIVYCYVYEGDAKPEFWFHYHSPDGGNQWVSFQSFGNVQFIDALLGWRMLSSAGSSDIERTEDGGVTWTKLKTVQWRGNLHFINRFVGWVIATSSNEETALLHTVDGGRTWDKINPVATGQ
jgi:photosystem II stability/assembly factor-like uncharacterized protein